jgi:putative ABC transport system substrate-binding protein
MKRREFITLLGGAAAWPLAASAQQPDRLRRIGVLMGFPESDSEAQGYIAAFMDRLHKLGWTEGRNLRICGSCGRAQAEAQSARRPTAIRPPAWR